MSMEYIRQKVYERELNKMRKSLTPEQEYNKMVEDILNIVNTAGFSQIVGYFRREKELHETRLEEMGEAVAGGKNIKKAQMDNVLTSLAVNKKFLMFLVNLLESKQVNN